MHSAGSTGVVAAVAVAAAAGSIWSAERWIVRYNAVGRPPHVCLVVRQAEHQWHADQGLHALGGGFSSSDTSRAAQAVAAVGLLFAWRSLSPAPFCLMQRNSSSTALLCSAQWKALSHAVATASIAAAPSEVLPPSATNCLAMSLGRSVARLRRLLLPPLLFAPLSCPLYYQHHRQHHRCRDPRWWQHMPCSHALIQRLLLRIASRFTVQKGQELGLSSVVKNSAYQIEG